MVLAAFLIGKVMLHHCGKENEVVALAAHSTGHCHPLALDKVRFFCFHVKVHMVNYLKMTLTGLLLVICWNI